jgi:single-stranded-DNA-specific exonuclease
LNGSVPRARARAWQSAACDDAAAARLAGALRIPPVLARLLVIRGIGEPDAAARFLDPSLDHLHSPWLLRDMPIAVDRILRAVAQGELIAVHGDYDVDGVTSTVMLRRVLEKLGANVTHFIPERLKDGYGLNPPAVERLHAEGVRLIVSVDCGVRSDAAALRARDLGVDLVVTDHHEPDEALPAALAVINPKRPDCRYPDKDLAGAGVAFKLVQALAERTALDPRWVRGFVKIAALGTIADVVPLVGENRVLAKVGLDDLSANRHGIGLHALLDEAGLVGRRVDGYHVSFVLAPRINAAGRMATPDIAAQLLLIGDPARTDEARALARQLSAENERRQDEERGILESARKVIEGDPAIGSHHVLVVDGPGWHRGVIGIVASKLVDSWCRPAVVLSVEGDVAHGSCRSIPAFDMLGALERCGELFERFGGHRQAAGFTIRAERIPELRRRMAAWGLEVLQPEDLFPRIRLDAELALADLTPDVVDGLERLAPFGQGNPAPLFSSGAVAVSDGPRPLKERHLAMSLKHGPRTFRAIMWRGADWAPLFEEHRSAVEVAYSIERNTYQGITSVELRLTAARPAPAGTLQVPAPAVPGAGGTVPA